MPPSARSSLSRCAGQLQQLALGQPGLLVGDALVEFAQPLDRLRDGLEVGQHAAEPAVVDVILAAALGRLGDRLLRLALGADEQHPAAAGDDVADRLQALVQHRHRLLEIDDVDAVAHAEDVGRHLRVPAPRVMAEMNAGFEQLTHRVSRYRHDRSFLRLSRRRRDRRPRNDAGDADTGAARPRNTRAAATAALREGSNRDYLRRRRPFDKAGAAHRRWHARITVRQALGSRPVLPHQSRRAEAALPGLRRLS